MPVFTQKKPNYYDYIQSDKWRKKADEAKYRAGYRCQVCNRSSREVVLDAHHRTYQRLGSELPEDITVLCRDCHELYEVQRKHIKSTDQATIRSPSMSSTPPLSRKDNVFTLVENKFDNEIRLTLFERIQQNKILKGIGQIFGVLLVTVFVLAQCATEDIFVQNPENGEYESLLTATLSDLREYLYIGRNTPSNASAFVAMGLDDLKNGKFDRAVEEFTKAIKLEPDNGDAYAGRGLAYDKLWKWEDAIKDLSHAIELGVGRADVYTTLGFSRFGSGGDLEQVIQDFTKAITLDPTNPRAYSGRGMAYKELDRFEEALIDFTKAIEYSPEESGYYKDRGNIYGNLEDFEKALIDYSKAIELAPNDSSAYRERGVIRFPLGQFKEAIEDFDKAIEHANESRDEVNMYLNFHLRGVAYAQIGNYEKAVGDYSKAMELNPQYVFPYCARGFAYGQLHNVKKAIPDLEKCLETAPTDTPDIEKIKKLLDELKSEPIN